MSSVIVGRWGRSLAIRLPGDIAGETGLKEGGRVDVEARDGMVVIQRAVPRFTLKELFAGKSPEEWREAYAGVFDWGPDIGREIVEE
jgi:antitoxin MazE